MGATNNFHLVRLAAALLVLFAHCFHLLDRAGEEPIGNWLVWSDASQIGVSIFFFVSGFLVTRSWQLHNNLPAFLVSRALRIAPALWTAVFIVVFPLGLMASTLPIDQYLRSPETAEYLLINTRFWLMTIPLFKRDLDGMANALFDTQYFLPGVFETNTVAGVNGSLWTIPFEVTLYAIIGTLGAVGFFSTKNNFQLVSARVARSPVVTCALLLIAVMLISKVLRGGAQYYSLGGYFLLGSLCYVYRKCLSLRIDLTLILIAVVFAFPHSSIGRTIFPLALISSILVFAMHPSLALGTTWLHRHDYSYGLYLYGFPVQQTLIALGVADPWTLLSWALPLTMIFAAFSWHLVERPALSLKRRVGSWLGAFRNEAEAVHAQ